MRQLLKTALAGVAIGAILCNSAYAADVKISALPAASALAGTEQIPAVQGGVTSAATPAQIKTFVAAGVNGALKANGSGVVSQAACADLSNGAASCSTDTTNAANIASGTLAAARGGAGATSGILKANGSGVVSAAVSGTDYAPGSVVGTVTSISAGVGQATAAGTCNSGTITSSGTLSSCNDVLTKTANYTLLNADGFKNIVLNAAGGLVITVPAASASGNFAEGWSVCFVDQAGTQTISAASGTPFYGSIGGAAANFTIGAAQTMCIASDGTNWAVSGSGPVLANPTAVVGTSAVNGSALTMMRSDGAPAIDLTMSPTWTGRHAFTPTAVASPSALTWQPNQSVVAGTSNTAGANFTLSGSQGTGTGAGGSVILQAAPAGGSGTAQNALVTGLTLDSTIHLRSGGSAPTCGTGCASVTGTDTAMVVTSGTAVTSFAVNFNKTWAAAPVCVTNGDASTAFTFITSVTTTVLTIGSSAAFTADKIYAHCVQ